MMRLDLIKTRVEIFSIAGFNISMAHIAGTIWYPNPKICTVRKKTLNSTYVVADVIPKSITAYFKFGYHLVPGRGTIT